jgi:hypothetical protein
MFEKIACMILTACVATVSQAEWVSPFTSGEMSFHFDPSSVRKTSYGARMWELFDYKTDQATVSKKNFRSLLVLAEYDCNGNRRRELSNTFYTGNMREGDSMLSAVITTWGSVAPSGAALSIAMSMACSSAKQQPDPQWIKTANDPEMGTIYADEKSVIRSKGTVKFNLLMDLKSAMVGAGNMPVRSAESLQELDCSKQVGRIIFSTLFSEQMGRGDVVPGYPTVTIWKSTSLTSDSMESAKYFCSNTH